MKTSSTSPVLSRNHTASRRQAPRNPLLRLEHLPRHKRRVAARVLLIGWAVCTTAAFAADKDPIDRISQATVFYQRLSPAGTASPATSENQELWKIVASAQTNGLAAIAPEIETFLAAHRNSPWAPSLRANLGYSYCQRGIYSKSLQNFRKAWEATRHDQADPGKTIADFTFAHWMQLLASLGRVEELRPLLRETHDRVFDGGPLQQLVSEARESFVIMVRYPGAAAACGASALEAVAKALVPPGADLRLIADAEPPQPGFTLSQLAALAKDAGLDLVPTAWLEVKPLPVPSVVHGRADHYTAVLERRGDLYRVLDPSVGVRWRTEADIRQEASGALLVPRDRMPKESPPLAKAQSDMVVGRGRIIGLTDEIDGCANGSGGGDPPSPALASGSGGQGAVTREIADAPGAAGPAAGAGDQFSISCTSCAGGGGGGGGSFCCPSDSGMAGWAVSDPYISLWLADQPIAYQPGLGSLVAFKLAYKQRETRPFASNFFSFGKMWNCSWFSYIWDAGAGYGELEAPLGGHRRYDDSSSAVEYYSHTKAERVTDGFGALSGWVVTHPDGAVDYYSFLPSIYLNGETVAFLTDQVDRFGNTNRFVYTETNSTVLLLYVVDPDGHTNTLAYEDANYPTQVTSVTDPYGRTATLEYDAATGMLTNITDPQSISSAFTYDSNGWATSLTTPYGTTSFLVATNNPGVSGYSEFDQGTNATWSFIVRSVVVVDPLGGTNIYMLRQDSTYVYNPDDDSFDNPFLPDQTPFPSSVVPDSPYEDFENTGYCSWRNTFHWGPMQASFVSTSDLSRFTTADFAKARLRHWLHDNTGYYATQNLSFERDPSPDGTTNTTGQMT